VQAMKILVSIQLIFLVAAAFDGVHFSAWISLFMFFHTSLQYSFLLN
jgi:hypothetical protein